MIEPIWLGTIYQRLDPCEQSIGNSIDLSYKATLKAIDSGSERKLYKKMNTNMKPELRKKNHSLDSVSDEM